MSFWDDFKAANASAAKARQNRFLKFGWIAAYINFFILAITIATLVVGYRAMIESPIYLFLSGSYVVFASAFTYGYFARRSAVMLPLLLFQGAIFIWTFIQTQRNSELLLDSAFKKQYSPFFTGLVFGVCAFVYIRKCYETGGIRDR